MRCDAVVFADQGNNGADFLAGQPQAVGQRCRQYLVLVGLSYCGQTGGVTVTEGGRKNGDTSLDQHSSLKSSGNMLTSLKWSKARTSRQMKMRTRNKDSGLMRVLGVSVFWISSICQLLSEPPACEAFVVPQQNLCEL